MSCQVPDSAHRSPFASRGRLASRHSSQRQHRSTLTRRSDNSRGGVSVADEVWGGMLRFERSQGWSGYSCYQDGQGWTYWQPERGPWAREGLCSGFEHFYLEVLRIQAGQRLKAARAQYLDQRLRLI